MILWCQEKALIFWKTTFQSEEKKHGSLIRKWLQSTLDKFCIKRIISSQRCNAVSLVTLRKSFQPGLSPPIHNPTKIMLLKATLKIGGRFAMAIHTGQSKLFRDFIILTSSKLNLKKYSIFLSQHCKPEEVCDPNQPHFYGRIRWLHQSVTQQYIFQFSYVV